MVGGKWLEENVLGVLFKWCLHVRNTLKDKRCTLHCEVFVEFNNFNTITDAATVGCI